MKYFAFPLKKLIGEANRSQKKILNAVKFSWTPEWSVQAFICSICKGPQVWHELRSLYSVDEIYEICISCKVRTSLSITWANATSVPTLEEYDRILDVNMYVSLFTSKLIQIASFVISWSEMADEFRPRSIGL